ncbi:UNVERIFIED_CONTAM: Aquaporin NIP1-1 [Sesamum angustifolium]|uniref:Aquaporin NIP1-1 n=1 Tax=Sesamum angustifolium TaxID=2727405 RepID=A0AAW2PCP1_9LAMI
MIYTVGHVSGAHFNPAVTIAFATCNRFAWRHVPAYISVQVLASILASGTVEMIFGTKQHHFLGTLPSNSNIQSLVLEFIITFYLMFAVSGRRTEWTGLGSYCNH